MGGRTGIACRWEACELARKLLDSGVVAHAAPAGQKCFPQDKEQLNKTIL